MGKISAADLILENSENNNQETKKSPTTETSIEGSAGTKTAQKGSAQKKTHRTAGKNIPASPTKINDQNNPPPKRVPSRRNTPSTAMPPEPEGIPGEKRINLPIWAELWRKLSTARIDDGIDTTTRIRAMIELWDHDPRLRKRIDQLAKTRAVTIHRGRPRTR